MQLLNMAGCAHGMCDIARNPFQGPAWDARDARSDTMCKTTDPVMSSPLYTSPDVPTCPLYPTTPLPPQTSRGPTYYPDLVNAGMF